MKMRRATVAKMLVGVGAMALFASVANPALAGTNYAYYSVDMPVAQFGAQTSAQTKATTNARADVFVQSVGSSYVADVTVCAGYGITCNGAKVTGLDDGDSARVQAPYAAGNVTVVAVFQSGSFNSVAVNVVGQWRSN